MNTGPMVDDSFGALLLAAREVQGRPGQVFEVIERDDGQVRVNDAARYFQPSWGKIDEWAYERVRGRVLDIGCGAGRHALALQRRGIPVVALDPSPGAIAVCRRRGVRHCHQGTVYDLDTAETFDTFLLLGNNLGLLGSREQTLPFLTRLAELSNDPNAQILASGTGIEPGASGLSAIDRAYVASNVARGRLPWQVRMRSRYRNLTTDWFDYLFLRLPDLIDLVASSPWRVVDHIDDGPSYTVQLALQRNL